MKLKRPLVIFALAVLAIGIRIALADSVLESEGDNAQVLRVAVKPSKTRVRIKEPFKVQLLVENRTPAIQHVRMMNCSWYDCWKTSNQQILFGGWDCDKNFAVTVDIVPGGAWTNELDMYIPKPISQDKLSFKMGFAPIGSPKTYWSDSVDIEILP